MNQTSAEIINESTNLLEPAYLMFFATIILVLVTLFYAIQTRRTVQALKESTELTVRPFVKFSIVYYFEGNICLQIINAGNGPAINVKSKYITKANEKETESTWDSVIFTSNNKERFLIEVDGKHETNMKYFETNEVIIETHVEYQNIFGKNFEANDTINVSKLIKSDSDHRILDDIDPLKRIADILRGIERKK